MPLKLYSKLENDTIYVFFLTVKVRGLISSKVTLILFFLFYKKAFFYIYV